MPISHSLTKMYYWSSNRAWNDSEALLQFVLSIFALNITFKASKIYPAQAQTQNFELLRLFMICC